MFKLTLLLCWIFCCNSVHSEHKPATTFWMLHQSTTENGGITMVHAIKPGYPMVFSNWPLVVDLRTGAFSGGSGERALLNAASAQLSNWLDLPSGVACSMTDAKAIDAQYGAEKGLTSLAGGNLIYESSGMTASLLGASFEAVMGPGHFLGGAHTLSAMERDYFYPSLADRVEPRTWAENGAKDAWTVARERVHRILETHHPEYLSKDQDAAIRSRFKIL